MGEECIRCLYSFIENLEEMGEFGENCVRSCVNEQSEGRKFLRRLFFSDIFCAESLIFKAFILRHTLYYFFVALFSVNIPVFISLAF